MLIFLLLVFAVVALGLRLALFPRDVAVSSRPGGTRRPAAETEDPDFRFHRQPLLVNDLETDAWHLLQATAGTLGAAAVCPKVRLEDVAAAVGPNWYRLRGHVRARHLDFVLVDMAWQPILAVEVDGASHAKASVRASDATKARVLSAAGIPLVRLGTDRQRWPRELAPFRRPVPRTLGGAEHAPDRAAGRGAGPGPNPEPFARRMSGGG